MCLASARADQVAHTVCTILANFYFNQKDLEAALKAGKELFERLDKGESVQMGELTASRQVEEGEEAGPETKAPLCIELDSKAFIGEFAFEAFHASVAALLNAFNEKYPKGTKCRTHHYRTVRVDDLVVGFICADQPEPIADMLARRSTDIRFLAAVP